VQRSFAWMARFRRMARDGEGLQETLIGQRVLAFAMIILTQAAPIEQERLPRCGAR
jgi:hypothetical protein